MKRRSLIVTLTVAPFAAGCPTLEDREAEQSLPVPILRLDSSVPTQQPAVAAQGSSPSNPHKVSPDPRGAAESTSASTPTSPSTVAPSIGTGSSTPSPVSRASSPAASITGASAAPRIAGSTATMPAPTSEPNLRPQPAPRATPPPKTRDMTTVTARIRSQRHRIRACYDQARKRQPDLAGRLTLKLEIDPEGVVKSVSHVAARSDLSEPGLVACAIGVLKSLRFLPSAKGFETVLTYPFELRP